MTKQTPIICSNCKRDTGMYYENFTNILLTDDVKCPYCNSILIGITRCEC